MKHQEPFWTTSNGEEVKGQEAVALALLEVFSDEDILVQDRFRFNGQTWLERAEAWVIHAVEQLEGELEDFKARHQKGRQSDDRCG
jgi:hypothetical protein